MRLTSAEFLGNRRLPLTVCRREPQVPYPPHQHEFTELVVVFAGTGRHIAGPDSQQITGGDVFIVSPGQAHGYADVRGLSLVNILYDENSLGIPLWGLRTLAGYQALFRLQGRRGGGGLQLDAEGLKQARSLIDRMEREVTEEAPGYELLALAYLMELLGLLARRYGRTADPQSSPLLRLGEAVAHLEKNFNRPVSLAELAGIAHMSQNTLLRSFRRATGQTPLAYQMQLRVRQAQEMLLRTDATIGEIAHAAGFPDSNYFARQFRRLTGVSPTACRKERTGGALPTNTV